MASSSRRMSQPASLHVNLHCLQCDGQIGIFDNEWTRLTSSYVRPVHSGTHFGTEIATNKTQVVPEGVTQRALEGCTLAEVFCTKCSAVVGQYCKEIPAAAQRNMLNQYLYKLSRTYLKSSETNKRVDPVFGYAGDAVRSAARSNATTRYSHTSFREETPPNPQPMTESHRRTSAHISPQNSQETPPFRKAADTDSRDSAIFQRAIQDTRLESDNGRMADQGSKTVEDDAQFRTISSVLETFRVAIDEIKTSIEELKSQILPPRLDKPTQIDFAGDIHTMIMTLKSAQTNAQELEELRAENAALRAKWDIVQSAMITATGQPSPSSSFEAPHRNSLGKRKRDSDVPRSSVMVPPVAPQTRSHYLETLSSSTQMPTPQSSNHSDEQSADDSSSSRISTPEQGPGRLKSRNIPDYHDQDTMQDNVSSKKMSSRRSLRKRQPSNPDRHMETANSVVRSAPGTRTKNDEAQPQGVEEASGPIETDRLLDSNYEQSMDVGHVDVSEIQSSLRQTVELGNESRHLSSTSLDIPGDDTTSQNVESSSEAYGADDASAETVPAKRTRSKTKAVSTGRRFDFIADSRSVAPEPAALRRILPRRLGTDQQARFEHATPETIEQELKELENPKGPRKSKPHIQTTTKILNKELKELGLEDWIERDKDDLEYKRVVEEARERKREQTRLAALASRGISLPGAPSENERPESPPNLQDAFHQATDALADVSNEKNGGKQISIITVSAAAARRATGTGMRRKRREQREEEIRRRDILAKQAMDGND
ncbi:uncharacterized protein PV07_11706 [Cladophialophora immunda]|uniref:Mis18 domain-containing protein n=1 Tax=Cladophialophora immunda TaxID=569365 RepID=A0A0D2CJ23_9EURO|nr:uncharacterized protein PV07_11706 [Cladophialophora immunda]KIW23514.1 hypothetical protein PV07_11706 [Cladophialophora immunda]OQV01699.1 hypothetical protein CLAIMM_07004 [Cladophialophora immunda]